MNADRGILEDLADEATSRGPRLSPRQRELLTLIARGESNKQISRTLGITEGTVKQHLSGLYKKLGVNSRTKALARIEELLGPLSELGKTKAAGSPETPEHSWRLVTAVAFVVQDSEGLSATDQTQLERGLRGLHQHLRRLAEAFDGKLLVAPGGNMLLGFGAPHSHLDDAARALLVARVLAVWLTGESILRIGIGVACSSSLVDFSDDPLFRSKAYDLALELARRAKPSQVLASDPICKLAGPLFQHRAEAQTDETIAPGLSAREVLHEQPEAAMLVKGTTLPFTKEAFGLARSGVAQWISIAGWPPSAAVQLMDAVSLHCEVGGFSTYRIRLASERDTGKFALNFYRQLQFFARLRERAEGNELLSYSQSDAQRALVALKLLCMRGPTALVVYGLGALESLARVFGDTGLQQLTKLPLLFIVTGGEANPEPHVVARLLGSQPLSAGASVKSFRLPLPRAAATPHDMNRDLSVLFELLSPPARQAVRLFVLHDKKSMVAGSKTGGMQLANELVTSGLFVREGESIVCRDATTRAALKKFLTDPGAAS